jgi:hypothetical protein
MNHSHKPPMTYFLRAEYITSARLRMAKLTDRRAGPQRCFLAAAMNLIGVLARGDDLPVAIWPVVLSSGPWRYLLAVKTLFGVKALHWAHIAIAAWPASHSN